MDQRLTLTPEQALDAPLARPPRLINPVAVAAEAHQKLLATADPAEIRKIEATLDAAENLMRATGLYPLDEMRPVNEERMRARWCLGLALSSFVRGTPFPGSATMSAGLTSFRAFLKELELDRQTAMEAQRIAALPDDVLTKAFEQWRNRPDLLHYTDLISISRPYWFKVNREARHRRIRAAAAGKMVLERPGPFPLIYADPPWSFDVYSEMGKENSPDRHYPTLTDEQIMEFEVAGIPVSEVAHDDAALLLWCTSSNEKRAFEIMEAWGFEYKSQAVWDKCRTGMGYVFLNQHEVLLYGTRGNIPAPQVQHPSVFKYPRGEHSAKPPEIRTAIEQMYPNFDEHTRLELFAREKVEGWTSYGFEA
jgi:N6-adenosine-specific RNA methylase IME4